MDDILQQTLEELKEELLGKFMTEDSLENYLRTKGFLNDELNYVKGEMLKQGFSFMKDTVTYRGDRFVATIPPNMPH